MRWDKPLPCRHFSIICISCFTNIMFAFPTNNDRVMQRSTIKNSKLLIGSVLAEVFEKY
jgi:hypothetical protein